MWSVWEWPNIVGLYGRAGINNNVHFIYCHFCSSLHKMCTLKIQRKHFKNVRIPFTKKLVMY